ncbi:hypothetical protein [Capnocytophaga catalasegens]|uniref:Uncharacterized protein n=1 Tax=Capnocytophaga catalasegens TaxID=1004260 RepID=A0AAV5ATP6_9FLAO|nr:hypothetical protein [Capnocytophaga catalasegens]GIZ15541.1 hypothetical protein RCZ03_15410 [Capnocytophaga catalasegens]GJM49884.1 hypothetical protein RCZ15_08590 [Capnocytophaga catalasegens]GJM54056.1 hypothetical protein RCZ16_23720 [Capnocytophaga catalasegens]
MMAKLQRNFGTTKLLNEKTKDFLERRIFKEYNQTQNADRRRRLVYLSMTLGLQTPFIDTPIQAINGQVLFGGLPYQDLTPKQKENFNFKIKLQKYEKFNQPTIQ